MKTLNFYSEWNGAKKRNTERNETKIKSTAMKRVFFEWIAVQYEVAQNFDWLRKSYTQHFGIFIIHFWCAYQSTRAPSSTIYRRPIWATRFEDSVEYFSYEEDILLWVNEFLAKWHVRVHWWIRISWRNKNEEKSKAKWHLSWVLFPF